MTRRHSDTFEVDRDPLGVVASHPPVPPQGKANRQLQEIKVCQFSMEFVGRVVERLGKRPSPEKIDAVT